MPIQALDIILLAVMILSGLLAMERGLIWGILSLVAWGAAALVTLVVYFIPHSIFGSEYNYRTGTGRGTTG